MKIRKQADELTLQDLQEHPVWEFALDEECEEGQDEATVRPYSLVGPLDPSEGTFIVRARFILADGTPLGGCLTPPPASGDVDLGMIQPRLRASGGWVFFWNGIFKPTVQDLEQNYIFLDRTADQVFPIHFTSDIELAGGPVTGILEAFLYIDSISDQILQIR